MLRGLTLLMQTRNQLAHALDIQCRPADDGLLGAKRQHLVQVAAVSLKRMGRHLALTAQVNAVSVQLPFHLAHRAQSVGKARQDPTQHLGYIAEEQRTHRAFVVLWITTGNRQYTV